MHVVQHTVRLTAEFRLDVGDANTLSTATWRQYKFEFVFKLQQNFTRTLNLRFRACTIHLHITLNVFRCRTCLTSNRVYDGVKYSSATKSMAPRGKKLNGVPTPSPSSLPSLPLPSPSNLPHYPPLPSSPLPSLPFSSPSLPSLRSRVP